MHFTLRSYAAVPSIRLKVSTGFIFFVNFILADLVDNFLHLFGNIYLHSANVFVLKAKRQLQKITDSIGGEGEMNTFL
jgi:hypothetical protein